MKGLNILIVTFLSCSIGNAQNLIINPGFEDTLSCPQGQGSLYAVANWTNPNDATPDYFNQCSSNFAGVPDNYYGYQAAHSGAGYCGIVTVNNSWPEFREYISGYLTSSLVAGQCYHFEMYISLANGCQITADNIGVYFSDTIIHDPTVFGFPVTPQLYITLGLPTDTVNWIHYQYYFIAQGGEHRVTIGNFLNDAGSPYQVFNPSGQFNYSFFYIDDVSLSVCTGVPETGSIDEFNVFPNPATDILWIKNNRQGDNAEIRINNIIGQTILHQEISNLSSLDISALSKGIYIYEVRNDNILVKKGKFVKD